MEHDLASIEAWVVGIRAWTATAATTNLPLDTTLGKGIALSARSTY